jgi:thiamine biosynthesis lipoprotein
MSHLTKGSATWIGRVAVAVTLAACGQGDDPAVAERDHFRALGTAVTIEVHAETQNGARAALDRARAAFETRHRAWYPWREEAALARINRRLAAGERADARPRLTRLLRRARALERASGGRFNPAIGALVELWGFHRPPPYTDPPPSRTAIEAALASRPSTRDLRLSRRRVATTDTSVQLDLGAIGKGAAVDAARRRIAASGAATALVNAGGDLAALAEPGQRPWRVGIRDPDGGVLATLGLQPGEAVFTSGDYTRHRGRDDAGRRLGHVLDPRTGQPARGAVQATAIAATGTRADAAATALLVAGAARWWRVARAMGLRHALIVAADGSLHANRALAQRLDFAGQRPPDLNLRALY